MSLILQDIKEILRRGIKYYSFFVWSYFLDASTKRTSPEKLKRRQLVKFRKLLHYAYEEIPFYRERLKSIGLHPSQIKSEEDILRIPMMTKDDIRKNFPDRLVAKNNKIKKNRIDRSSGSTGEAVYFISSKGWKRNIYMSILMRTKWRNKIVATLTTPQCTGTSCSITDKAETMEDKMRDWLIWTHLNPLIFLPSSTNIIMESDDYFFHLLKIVRKYKPSYYFADPVYLASFARFLKRKEIEISNIRGIITTYELLKKSDKILLEEIFGCDVYNQYGCSELQDIADECEFHQLHVRMDTVYVEFIWGDKPVGPGGLGKIVITDLDNYDMPLIRYELGDLGRWNEKECPCGRKTMVIEDIEGRITDLLFTSDGKVITSRQIDNVLSEVEGVDIYQVIQNDLDEIDILLFNPDKHVPNNCHNEIKEKIYNIFGTNVKINISDTQGILPGSSKKYRFVYSKIPDNERQI